MQDVSLAIQDGINSTSASSFATYDALLSGNELSPYSTVPYPAINFTHGDAGLYLETFPCTGTISNLPVDPRGTLVTTARYSDLVGGLTGLKALLENGVGIDKDNNDGGIAFFHSVPSKSQQPQYRPLSRPGSVNWVEYGTLFALMTLQSRKGEWRRLSYEFEWFTKVKCDNSERNGTAVRPVDVDR